MLNEFKGTPGPWQVVKHAIGYSPELSECLVWTDRGPGYGLVATTSPFGMPYSTGKQAHDALLIAAAPDLLAACQAVLDSGIYYADAPDAIDAIKAAIAKATATI